MHQRLHMRSLDARMTVVYLYYRATELLSPACASSTCSSFDLTVFTTDFIFEHMNVAFVPRASFVPPGRSAIEWTRYCKGSVSRMQKAVENGRSVSCGLILMTFRL